MFREVRVYEIREVLRLWVAARACAPLSAWRGWTARPSAATWRQPSMRHRPRRVVNRLPTTLSASPVIGPGDRPRASSLRPLSPPGGQQEPPCSATDGPPGSSPATSKSPTPLSA